VFRLGVISSQESLEMMRIVKQQGREIIHISMNIAENKEHTDFSTFLKDSNISEDKFKTTTNAVHSFF
jgi:ABC-type sugar transport system ATPase subunit